jgi:hypothetical protein
LSTPLHHEHEAQTLSVPFLWPYHGSLQTCMLSDTLFSYFTLNFVPTMLCANSSLTPYPILKLSCSDNLCQWPHGLHWGCTDISDVVYIPHGSYAYMFSKELTLPSVHGIQRALCTSESHQSVVSPLWDNPECLHGKFIFLLSKDMVATVIFTEATPWLIPSSTGWGTVIQRSPKEGNSQILEQKICSWEHSWISYISSSL